MLTDGKDSKEMYDKSGIMSRVDAKSHGVVHVMHAVKYSICGLATCFRHETAFRQEILMGILNAIAVVSLPLDFLIRLLLILVWMLILCVELLNSALEAIVDLVSPNWNELAKRAKDYGSAAVFIVQTMFWGAWVIVLVKLALHDS